MMAETHQRRRVVICDVKPELDCGRYPIKRAVGEWVEVEADIYADGHDAVFGVLLYRKESRGDWQEAAMMPAGNDRWRARFRVEEIGRYRYTVEGWVDRLQTWLRDMRKKIEAEQDEAADFLAGARWMEEAAGRAAGVDRANLLEWASYLRSSASWALKRALVLRPEVADAALRHPDRSLATRYPKELAVVADRERARFGAWYEFFPRSCGGLRKCEAWLDYIAALGFDVVYLPPIHPIGKVNRKGKNNALACGPEDVGSPWAIGSDEGGHRSIDRQLGTLEDFDGFLRHADARGLEVAMDLAFQCAPDHPYVREHPEWFRKRPDGTIQYAENPPKKYQDIYPLDFETADWRALWNELAGVVRFWIGRGVRIFRVDNPHTKAFPFWEWLIAEIQRDYPETIFLAEAFTRPKVMYQLAKLGFTQSYTYFTWRNSKAELIEYFTELTQSEVREYFRPNLWPNTPDILPEYLQYGGQPAFAVRFVLAATLGANYGIYGPAFELGENRAKCAGSEEYLDSEKYQIRQWDISGSSGLKDLIRRVNHARRENPALQNDWSLCFHHVDNEQILCYSKSAPELSNFILAVVNLDPLHKHSGWVDLQLQPLGLDVCGAAPTFQVEDLLTGNRYFWNGPRNYVELDPQGIPAHLFRIRRKVRTERDFDYFL
jgi:starch synthase (maltosyl-transferring)